MAFVFFFKLYEEETIVQGLGLFFSVCLPIVPLFPRMVLCYGIQTSFFDAFADSWEPVYMRCPSRKNDLLRWHFFERRCTMP